MSVLLSSLQTEGRGWLDRDPGVSSRAAGAGKKAAGTVAKDECRHCGQKGHFEVECWIKHPEKAAPGWQPGDVAAAAEAVVAAAVDEEKAKARTRAKEKESTKGGTARGTRTVKARAKDMLEQEARMVANSVSSIRSVVTAEGGTMLRKIVFGVPTEATGTEMEMGMAMLRRGRTPTSRLWFLAMSCRS